MAISFESALGIHEPALKVRTQRAEVLSSNLANADTPNYKARDIDFQEALAKHSGNSQPFGMAATHARHIPMEGNGVASELRYRVPNQPSIDGNTVEEHVEHGEFMKNALDMQASFTFLNGSFKGLSKALTGQ